MCTYAGDFSLFFTVPSVTVPYLFLVTGDMVTIELVNIPCVRMRVRTQEGFFLFLLSPRHLVIFRSTSGRLQSKNLPLDLRSLAKQECFCRKDTTNETLQSDFPFFSFFSFDSFFSFFSPLIVHRLFVSTLVGYSQTARLRVITAILLLRNRPLLGWICNPTVMSISIFNA